MELDHTKNIYIFPNEYCKDTAVKTKCSAQEKEVKLQINALKWYQKKIVSGSAKTVSCLLTS